MEKGVTNVPALRGGWAAWQQAGFPVEGMKVVAPTATASGLASGGGMAVLGRADAPVTIVEFSDYQCPYCRQYALQTLPKIKETYIDTGQVRYLFKDYPLPSHPSAQKAAEAAHCAGAQGAFWEMHARLFESQSTWSQQGQEGAIDAFVRYAKELGLEDVAFRACLEGGQFGEQIRQDQWEGEQAGVYGTPSFLVNDQLLAGAYPFETFQEIIEAKLQTRP